MWETISGVLGILGFIISFINITCYFVYNQIDLEIKIIEYIIKPYHSKQDRIMIHYQVNNKSHLPISVTDLQLIMNDNYYNEDYNTHRIISYNIDDDYKAVYNKHLPINLTCLSSDSGYIVYAVPQDTLTETDKPLTFEIRTNRNMVTKKTFAPNEWVSIRHTLLSR